ncbi:MAG: energy transducer TonB [Deltaproteobacteria bacterium]|nr:energy transducer TonB [Deltaproteobacteria bacterium]
MSDPVGERRDGMPLSGGVMLLSLLLHLAILSLVFFSPSFPSPKVTFGPVYTVSLVNLPADALTQKNDTAVAKELMTEERPERVFKKQSDPAAAIPIRSMESRKKPDRTLEKAMEEIRRKVAASETAKPAPAKAAPEKPAALPAASAAQGGNAGEVNAQLRAYYALIWSRIKGKWALPQGILPGEVLETVIHVTILRSGAVTEITFEKRSGNRYFDDSAMKAIRKASPFPPLTAGVGDSSIDVGIRFHSSELKP